MAGFLRADLPSDDSEDEDYDATKDKTAEKEDQLGREQKAAAGKRKRGVVRGTAAAGADEQDEEAGDGVGGGSGDEDIVSPSTAAKRAKASAIFERLNKTSCAGLSPAAVAATAPVAGTSSATAGKPSISLADLKAVSLSSLCKPAKQKKKKDADKFWMQQLGVSGNKAAPAQGGRSGLPKQDGAATAAASAALEAAKTAVSASAAAKAGKVMVTETRKFAGQDIQVTTAMDADSKQAKKAQEQAKGNKSGLDAVLQGLAATKKVTVLDKSRQDWSGFKETNVSVEEELEGHKKSADQYLDKQGFLQRADLKQYEQERDQRLASDMRTRGRL